MSVVVDLWVSQRYFAGVRTLGDCRLSSYMLNPGTLKPKIPQALRFES